MEGLFILVTEFTYWVGRPVTVQVLDSINSSLGYVCYVLPLS